MKKKWKVILCIALAVVAVLIGVVCALTEPEVDMNEMVTVYCLSEITEIREGRDPFKVRSFQYDENGNMISVTTYDYFDGSEDDITYMEYDARGNLIHQYDDTFEYFFSYDEADRLLMESKYFWGEESYKKVYTYDDCGNRIQREESRNGVINDTYVYTYDDRNNLIREERVNGETVTLLRTWTYDYADRCLSEIYHDSPAGKDAWYWKYDIRGNLISYQYRQGENEEKLRDHTTYTYDIFGRLKAKETISDGNLSYREVNTYDIWGNLVKQECVQPPDMYIDSNPPTYQAVYTYEYDKNGNMVRRWCDHEYYGTEEYIWVYDEQGRLVTREYWGRRVDVTYDQWGNIVSKTERSSSGTVTTERYTYVSFQVPRWLAEKIMQQQKQYEVYIG